MTTLSTLLDWWPVVGALFLWAVSIERRLAKIQADICWIKKALQPPK